MANLTSKPHIVASRAWLQEFGGEALSPTMLTRFQAWQKTTDISCWVCSHGCHAEFWATCGPGGALPWEVRRWLACTTS
jgi:hypothetical protein